MASNNTVEIQVTADTAQAQVGLGNVNKGLAETGNSAAALQGKAAAAGQGLNQTAGAAGKTTEALDKTAKSATATGTAFGGIGALIAGAFTGRELVQTITQADSLQRGMAAVAGSSKAAAEEMAFVKRISNELGLEINSTGQAYLQLTAATKGTAIEGQATRDVFTSVSRAMSALGKSTAETENALRAVSQIASKGTVSMEELRGQLGEALPGALKAAADGLKVTVPELIKMVESGGVLAKDLLPALSKSLDDLYAGGGSPDTLVAQFNRFKNAVSAVAVELGESGLTKALGDAAVGGAKVAGLLGSAFVGLGKGIGNVAGAVATLDFKPLAADLGLTGRAAQDFSELTYDAMGNLIGSTQQAIPPVQELQQKLEGAAVAAGKLGLVATDFGNESKSAFRKAEIAAQNAEAVLSQAAKNSAAAFDKFKESGDSAAEAVAKIGKGFDLSTAPGIRDAANVLNQLVAQGKITADQFNKTWTDALKGVDLTEFAAKAKKAFEDTNQSAAVLAGVLNQGVREAIKRTGLDFEVISGGMGKAARSAINDTTAIIAGLDGLKKQGVDTAAVLTASIGKGIATADSQKAIEAVRLQIESLRKALGDKVTDGLLDQAKTKALELADALAKATPGINSLREAMQQLGITSDESLRNTAKVSKEAYDTMRESGKASARELGLGFAKAAQDAIDAAKGIAPSWVTAQAGARGYELAVDAAGKTTVKAMAAGGEAVDTLRGKVQAATQDFEKQAAALDAINAKYSRPGEGKSNSVLTKDELKPVDNTGLDALRAKSQAGTLGKDDLATAEAAFKAAAANLEVFQKNSFTFSTEGARSIQESYAAAKAILDKLKSLPLDGGKAGSATPAAAPSAPNASPSPAPAPSTRLPIRTVNINLTGAGGTETVPTTEAGAAALLRVLQNARLSA